jgi:hypothetical protein
MAGLMAGFCIPFKEQGSGVATDGLAALVLFSDVEYGLI